jgi:two-component system chemotaxis sensor kinase CheA
MAQDRTRYFRIEARELLDALSRGLLELERAPADRALVAKLLRHAHTLKGAARVVQQTAIGDLAHEAEDALAAHRDEAAPPVGRERIDALLRLVDEVAARVVALEPAAAVPTAEAAPAHAAEDALQTARVDLREMDALHASVLEASVHATSVRRQLARVDHALEVTRALADRLSSRRGDGDGSGETVQRARAMVDELRRTLEDAQRALGTDADRAEREIAQVRNVADRLRLVPVRALFGPLERAARDAARTLDRAVTFGTAGGDVRVDATVLTALRGALLHAVRNAVAHGIEPARERERAGKPAAGQVRIEVERRAARVVFRCVDDGGGIDAGAVRDAAVRRGVVSALDAASLGDREVAALLLRGGISTAPALSDVAGRAVGLDVVRDTAERLRGEVALHSDPGKGTVLEIAVPVSLSAMTALHLEGAGLRAALPLDAVRETVFLDPSRVARSSEGMTMVHEGTVVPFLPLARALGEAAPPAPRRFWSAVLVDAGPRRVALGADRLGGASDVVVRPLPGFVEALPTVSGAFLDAEGNPELMLDPAGLLAVAAEAARDLEEAPTPARKAILVVDDSLTTRMLEQSILESAGYEVELAVSGEDALEKARARPFALFVVDVEMPGIDGFELVRTARADPRLAAIPSILVTSRAAPEDRRRGMEAGAKAYIVKGEFDQGALLAAIEDLVR